eukprot:5399922-Prorocentrum_lima.AAC.1
MSTSRNLTVWGSDGKDVTVSWYHYQEMLSKVLLWGLLKKCPDPFSTEHFDTVKNSMTVRASLTELAHAISRLDNTLAAHLSLFPDMAGHQE